MRQKRDVKFLAESYRCFCQTVFIFWLLSWCRTSLKHVLMGHYCSLDSDQCGFKKALCSQIVLIVYPEDNLNCIASVMRLYHLVFYLVIRSNALT